MEEELHPKNSHILAFRPILIVLFICLLITPLFSQTEVRRWGVGVGAAMIDYQRPVTGTYSFRPAVQIQARRYLRGAFDFTTNLLYAPGVDYPELSGQTPEEMPWLADMMYTLNFKLNNGVFFKEDAFIGPFGTFGIGGSYVGSNRPDVYLPLGGGVRFRLGPHVSLRFESLKKISVNRDFNSTQHGVSVLFNFGKPRQARLPFEQSLPPASLADSDSDGVPDYKDICTFIPGYINYFGCPDLESYELASYGYNLGGRDPLVSEERKNAAQKEGKTAVPSVMFEENVQLFLRPSLTEGDSADGEWYPLAEAGLDESHSEGAGSETGDPDWPFHLHALTDGPLGYISFDSGKDDLSRDSQGFLDGLATLMQVKGELKVLLVGHADGSGSEAQNLSLSMKRASTAKTYLISRHRIDRTRILSLGMGEKEPRSTNQTAEGRALNRRVDIMLLY